MESQHVFDLIPEYTLGILDETEVKEVEHHLDSCQLCRVELQSYQNVVSEIPLAVKTIQPPSHLKEGVMELVRADRQVADKTNRFSPWDRFRRTLVGSAPVWGAMSLVLVLILAVSNLVLWQRVNYLSSSQQEMNAVAFKGTEATPQAVGMLVMSEEGDYGVLVVDGLPVLPDSQQYQLWLIEDGERTSGGVFSVNEEGYGTIIVSAQQPLLSYPAFGITIEPAGGSPGPTGIKVLGGESS